MKNDVKELKRELDEIRIQLGVRNEIIAKQLGMLSKFDIKTLSQAQNILDSLTEKIKRLEEKETYLINKAKRILNEVR
jgi:uncharacterized protein (DUF885 family)